MVITLNGPSGLTAVQLVEEVRKHEQGLAPAPLHSTVERTAKNWDQLVRHRNATQTHVVSTYDITTW